MSDGTATATAAPAGEWLNFTFDAPTVTLSILVSFMGALAAVELNETRRFEKDVASRRRLAVAVAAVVGTSAIWCMHFVGMAALLLESPHGEIVTIHYRVDLTFASWVAAVLMQMLGVSVVALKDPFFSATDHDAAIALVRKELLNQPFKTLTSNKPTRIVATIKVQWIVLGGLISGLGVSLMHYLGLVSQVVLDAKLVPRADMIAVSVVFAVSAASAAFWILFRLPLLYWDSIYLRLSSAALMTLAVSSMHYSGMYGMQYQYTPGRGDTESTTIDTQTESFIAVFVSMVVFAVIFFWLLAELRAQVAEVARQRSRDGTKSLSGEVPTSTMFSAALSAFGQSTTESTRPKYVYTQHKTLTKKLASQATEGVEKTVSARRNSASAAQSSRGGPRGAAACALPIKKVLTTSITINSAANVNNGVCRTPSLPVRSPTYTVGGTVVFQPEETEKEDLESAMHTSRSVTCRTV